MIEFPNNFMKSPEIETIGIIPVRSGSKRFPNKNFSHFKIDKEIQTTLIARTIEKLVVSRVNKIIISTDVPEKIDVHPPLAFTNLFVYKRSNENSQDYSTQNDVVSEVIEQINIKENYIIVLSQVTSPLWSSHKLTQALHSIKAYPENTIVSVSPSYSPNGAFYVFTKDKFLKTKKIYSSPLSVVPLTWKESIDVDYEYQLLIAEALHNGDVL